MNALGNKVSVFHLVLVTIELDKLNDTIHQLLSHGFIHFALNGLKPDLPERSAFIPQQICPFENKEDVAESLHPHAERDPGVPEKV